jgi:hypothetical protein
VSSTMVSKEVGGRMPKSTGSSFSGNGGISCILFVMRGRDPVGMTGGGIFRSMETDLLF